MERELWHRLYHRIQSVGGKPHQKSVQYQPWLIVMVIVWAALHDRPMSGTPGGGKGHHYQSPYRLRGIELQSHQFGEDLSSPATRLREISVTPSHSPMASAPCRLGFALFPE